jgi:hypothetical protein
MKFIAHLLFIMMLLLVVLLTQHTSDVNSLHEFTANKQVNVFKTQKEPKKYDKPDQAARWLADMRQTPKAIKNPSQINMDIKRQIQAAEKALKSDHTLAMRFDEIGPGVFGGRIRGFTIHPSQPGHLLAGGVSGGVWKSTDDGQSWEPKADFLPNIAIGSMLVDPDNSERVFIGTGEGFFNFDAAQGAGIFVSEDFGETWQQLASTNQSDFFYVNRLARIPDSDVLLAATNAGIMRSDDLGQTWQEVSGHDTTGRGFTDLKRDPSNDQHLLAYHFGNPNQVQASLVITAPGSLAGQYDAVPADFGGTIADNGITGEILLGRDNVGATQDACESITNNISGKIALVQRGQCDFTVKVKNAQNAGAKAVVVYQNDSSLPIIMGGEDSSITIPAVMITLSLGNDIINAQSTVSGIIEPSEVRNLERFIARSVDAGHSWQKLADNGLPIEELERMEIGFAQTGKIYVAASKEAVDLSGGGTSGTLGLWSANPGSQLQFAKTASQTNFIERQGWYDLAIAVNPNDANHVLMGAIDLYSSSDGGTSIVKKSNWYVQPGQAERYIHADHHGYFFSPHDPDDVYFVTDGGVTKSEDGGNTFTDLNNGLNISQSYGIAVSPDGRFVNSGTQDNGAQLYFGDTQNWLEWQGGDGGYSAWDQQQGNYVYNSYVRGQMYGSSDGGLTAEAIELPDTEGARFIQPYVLDDNNGNRMLVGTNRVYYSNNVRQLGNANWQDVTGVVTGASVSAVAFNPHNPSQAFAGFANINTNHMVKINGLGSSNTVTNITFDSQIIGYNSTVVTDIRVDEFDTTGNTLYVTLGGYDQNRIVKSTDGGLSWTSIANNLPEIPLFQVINDPVEADRLFVGSELGLWVGETTNGFNYDWQRYQYGPAFTRVVDLVWQGDNDLYIGTHGRGTYRAQRNPVSVSLVKFIATDASCDDDNFLDRGEQGNFMMKVENHSDQSLSQVAVSLNHSGSLSIIDGTKHVNLGPFGRRHIPVKVSLSDAASCAADINIPVTVITETGQFTSEVTAQTAVNQTLSQGDFFAGAEAGDSMQKQLNLGNNEWQKDNSKAFSGDASWFAASEDNFSDKTLTSPWLTLAGGGNELSYALSYDLEFGNNQYWDGAVLEMQIKGDEQWIDIGLLSTLPYDGQLGNNNTAQGHFVWSGEQLDWREGLVDLGDAYVGKTVRFRFRVMSDTNSAATGFWVDDILLTNVYNREKFSCDSCVNSGNIRPLKGSWYDPKYNGHGFIIEYAGRDDLYYSMFYTYDEDGMPEWYLSYTFLENGVLNDAFEPDTLQKPKYDYAIDPEQGFPLIPDPGLSDGRLRIDFNNQVARNHSACQDGTERNLDQVALAQWRINNEQQTWCIQPIVSNENKAEPDFGNAWYAGDNDEGWGISVVHAKNTTQSYLFYYDGDGNSRWALADKPGLTSGEDYNTGFFQVQGYPRDGIRQDLQFNQIGTLRYNLRNTLQDLNTDGDADFDVTYDGIEGGHWQRQGIPVKTLMQAH